MSTTRRPVGSGVASRPVRATFFVQLMLASGAIWASPPENLAFEEKMPPVVEAIDTAIAEWMRVVTFCGNYRHRVGVALSRENALAGRFIDPKTGERLRTVHPDDSESADGFVAKTEDAFRWSYHRITPLAHQANYIVNSSFDIAASNGVVVQYRPLQAAGRRRIGGVVSVFLAKDDGLKGRYPCPGPPFMPLFAVAGTTGRPLSPREGYNERTRWAVKQRGAKDLLIVIERAPASPKGIETGDMRFLSYYHFTLSGRYPVLNRVTSGSSTGDYAATAPQFETMPVTELSSFVPAGKGCSVPRHVASAMPIELRSAAGKKLWLGRIWHSDDLGKCQPSKDDFLITVPEGTRIEGISGKNDRVFDVQSIQSEDVVSATAGPAPPSAFARENLSPTSVGTGSSAYIRLFGIALAMVGLICLAFFYRGKARKVSS